MNMKQELQDHLNATLKRVDNKAKEIMKASAQKLIDDKVGANAIKVGHKLPDVTLINATNEQINIYDYLKQGPLIINFYRGAWCPYCNIELRAYKDLLPAIKKAGGNLLAISPELPDTSLSLTEKHDLDFEVLSDINNAYAQKLGLVFKVDDELLGVYKKFGIDWDEAQGNTNKELPIPATFVIDIDGSVLLASINTDYTKRIEPSEVLKVLTANSN